MRAAGAICRSCVTVSAIDAPASDKSRMTQAGGCLRACSSRAGMVFTDRNSRPRSRPVPAMRLVKIRSSQSRSPFAAMMYSLILFIRRFRRFHRLDSNNLCNLRNLRIGLNRLGAAFASADADAIFQRQDENLAIADAAF